MKLIKPSIYSCIVITLLLIAGTSACAVAAKPPELFTVKYEPISQTLYFHGNIQPLKQVPVISPTEGVIVRRFFHYGEMVKQGQPLITVSTMKIQQKLRTAEINYLKAKQAYDAIKNWQGNVNLIQARNGLIKAQEQLQTAKTTYHENQHLFKLGIVSENALTQSQQAYQSAQMSEKQAKLSLDSTLKKDKGIGLLSAKLNYLNAKDNYDSLQAQNKATDIKAPSTGIALKPPQSEQNNNSSNNSNNSSDGSINVGSHITYQQVLLNIGDLSGIQVHFKIPEVNIDAMHATLPVTITSSAFPSLTMKGEVVSVSAQAGDGSDSSGGGSSSPTFAGIANVQKLSPKAKRLIRSGMRVTLAIVVSKASHRLVVPVSAVTKNKQGKRIVRLYNPETKTISDQIVQTGKVMPQMVEILSGLVAGDQVVI